MFFRHAECNCYRAYTPQQFRSWTGVDPYSCGVADLFWTGIWHFVSGVQQQRVDPSTRKGTIGWLLAVFWDVCKNPNFPYVNKLSGTHCYSQQHYAISGSGPCDSWCALDATISDGCSGCCGNIHSKLCRKKTSNYFLEQKVYLGTINSHQGLRLLHSNDWG